MSTRSFRERDSEPRNITISKRLCYVLRHGAEKENLTLYKGGYVNVDQILLCPPLKGIGLEELRSVIRESTSLRDNHTKRFESMFVNGREYVRASYGRSVQKEEQEFPLSSVDDLSHFFKDNILEDDGVPKLFLLCVKNIISNIKMYDDFAGIGDSFLLESIMDELKRPVKGGSSTSRLEKMQNNNKPPPKIKKNATNANSNVNMILNNANTNESSSKLTNANLKMFLVPDLDRLELSDGDVALADSTLRKIGTNCSGLTTLKLVGQVSVTDTAIQFIVKRCKNLRVLEFGDCKYITDAALEHIAKCCGKNLRSFTIVSSPLVTDSGIGALVECCKSLQSLGVVDCEKTSDKILDLQAKYPHLLNCTYKKVVHHNASNWDNSTGTF